MDKILSLNKLSFGTKYNSIFRGDYLVIFLSIKIFSEELHSFYFSINTFLKVSNRSNFCYFSLTKINGPILFRTYPKFI